MISQQISLDMVTALKTGERLRLETLRMAWNQISLKTKEKKLEYLSDADTISIIRTMIKQRQDSISAFVKGHRPELAAKEESEIGILGVYLPAEASTEQLNVYINRLLVSAFKPKLGEVIKSVKEAAERDGYIVDGKILSGLVKDALGVN